MPSQVWGRDPQEAFEEPYEYEIQAQFQREARALLDQLFKALNSEKFNFALADNSREKAVWLLAMDALDSLRDSLDALGRKNHRVAGKLFRDIVESMDLAAYFNTGNQESKSFLRKWYADEVVPHRAYRDFVKQTRDEQAAKNLAKQYSNLSSFTHRSYRTILDGYSLGLDNRLIHDRTGEIFGKSELSALLLVLPQTIAVYFAMLAQLTIDYIFELAELGLASPNEIQEIFRTALETDTVPRKFLPRRWWLEKPDSSAV